MRPERRCAGAAVRLQLRLPRHPPARRPARHAGPRGGQPRVHQRDHHVPADDRPGDARRASASRSPPTACPWSASAQRRPGRPWRLDPSTQLQPPDHRQTPFLVDGPVAGHDLLKTKDDPSGTRRARHPQQLLRWHDAVGHRAVRRGELQPVLRRERRHARDRPYGIPTIVAADVRRGGPSTHASTPAPPATRTRSNRFGWVVEIDPMDPDSTPVKHTALGRFKHEAATIRIAPSGHVVAYSGDDERFDYVYKFVSRRTLRRLRHVCRPRAQHDAARATATSTSRGSPATPPAARSPAPARCPPTAPSTGPARGCRWSRTASPRGAGHERRRGPGVHPARRRRVGATKMDRPEDIEVNPTTGTSTSALTNNSHRGSPAPVAGAGRRGQPAHRQPGRPRRSSSSRRTTTRPATTFSGTSCSSAAWPTPPAPTSVATRGRSRPSRAPTTWPSTPRATCGSPPTASPGPSSSPTRCTRSP